MAHPMLHAKSSVKKFGGKVEDYIHIHNWFDETKAWYGHSNHRIFRHQYRDWETDRKSTRLNSSH